jgi:hypothetical protein
MPASIPYRSFASRLESIIPAEASTLSTAKDAAEYEVGLLIGGSPISANFTADQDILDYESEPEVVNNPAPPPQLHRLVATVNRDVAVTSRHTV